MVLVIFFCRNKCRSLAADDIDAGDAAVNITIELGNITIDARTKQYRYYF